MFQILQVIGDLKNFFGSKDPEIISMKEIIKKNGVSVLFNSDQFLHQAFVAEDAIHKRKWISGDGTSDPYPRFNPKIVQVVIITTNINEFKFIMYLPLSMFM
jgi:hypothetical protein